VAKKTLTDKFVQTAPGPTGDARQCDYWDAATPGLSLRVTSEGVRSWTVLYRIDGKQVRQTLGRVPGVSLADARRRAADVRDLVATGKDPRQEVERERQEQVQARADTVAAVIQRYLASIGEYLFGVREGKWKYTLEATSGREFLTDLATDPRELKNLARSQPAICRGLRSRVAAWVDFEDKFMRTNGDVIAKNPANFNQSTPH
jgi:arylsulfatase A-like enzyme